MRAVRATGEGEVVVVDVEPTTPEYATDPVRVRVRTCSICGSDLHMLGFGIGCTLGHEFAGILDDGTAVAVRPYLPCRVCDLCRAGMPEACRELIWRSHGIAIDGGLADEVVVDRASVFPLPPTVTPEIGCLVEPIAIAVRAANCAGLDGKSRDEPVLVVGAGSVGLLVVAVARRRGYRVDLVSRHPAQAEAGERLGAGRTQEGGEYGVVVDAAGSQGSFDASVAAVRPGGTIAVVGTWWDPISVDAGVLLKQARLVPAMLYGERDGRSDFQEAVDVLAADPGLADVVVTHRFPLADAAEAFSTARNRAAGAIKIAIQPAS